MARSTISDLRLVQNRSFMLWLPWMRTVTHWLSVMDTRTTAILNWLCWHRKWVDAFSLSLRSSTSWSALPKSASDLACALISVSESNWHRKVVESGKRVVATPANSVSPLASYWKLLTTWKSLILKTVSNWFTSISVVKSLKSVTSKRLCAKHHNSTYNCVNLDMRWNLRISVVDLVWIMMVHVRLVARVV